MWKGAVKAGLILVCVAAVTTAVLGGWGILSDEPLPSAAQTVANHLPWLKWLTPAKSGATGPGAGFTAGEKDGGPGELVQWEVCAVPDVQEAGSFEWGLRNMLGRRPPGDAPRIPPRKPGTAPAVQPPPPPPPPPVSGVLVQVNVEFSSPTGNERFWPFLDGIRILRQPQGGAVANAQEIFRRTGKDWRKWCDEQAASPRPAGPAKSDRTRDAFFFWDHTAPAGVRQEYRVFLLKKSAPPLESGVCTAIPLPLPALELERTPAGGVTLRWSAERQAAAEAPDARLGVTLGSEYELARFLYGPGTCKLPVSLQTLRRKGVEWILSGHFSGAVWNSQTGAATRELPFAMTRRLDLSVFFPGEFRSTSTGLESVLLRGDRYGNASTVRTEMERFFWASNTLVLNSFRSDKRQLRYVSQIQLNLSGVTRSRFGLVGTETGERESLVGGVDTPPPGVSQRCHYYLIPGGSGEWRKQDAPRVSLVRLPLPEAIRAHPFDGAVKVTWKPPEWNPADWVAGPDVVILRLTQEELLAMQKRPDMTKARILARCPASRGEYLDRNVQNGQAYAYFIRMEGVCRATGWENSVGEFEMLLEESAPVHSGFKGLPIMAQPGLPRPLRVVPLAVSDPTAPQATRMQAVLFNPLGNLPWVELLERSQAPALAAEQSLQPLTTAATNPDGTGEASRALAADVILRGQIREAEYRQWLDLWMEDLKNARRERLVTLPLDNGDAAKAADELVKALAVRFPETVALLQNRPGAAAPAPDNAGGAERKTLAVLPFVIAQSTTAGYQGGMEDLLIQEFSSQKKYAVVDRGEMQKILKEWQLAGSGNNESGRIQLGKLAKADLMVFGMGTAENGRLNVTARITDAATGAVLAAADAEGPVADLDALCRKLAASLRPGSTPAAAGGAGANPILRLLEAQVFSAGNRGGTKAGGTDDLKTAVFLSPENVDQRLKLGESLEKEKPEQALDEYREALRLSDPSSMQADNCRNHVERTLTSLGREEELPKLYEQAIAAKEAKKLPAGDWRCRYAALLLGQNRTNEAVEQLLQVSAPMLRAATLLEQAGRLDEAVTMYLKLSERSRGALRPRPADSPRAMAAAAAAAVAAPSAEPNSPTPGAALLMDFDPANETVQDPFGETVALYHNLARLSQTAPAGRRGEIQAAWTGMAERFMPPKAFAVELATLPAAEKVSPKESLRYGGSCLRLGYVEEAVRYFERTAAGGGAGHEQVTALAQLAKIDLALNRRDQAAARVAAMGNVQFAKEDAAFAFLAKKNMDAIRAVLAGEKPAEPLPLRPQTKAPAPAPNTSLTCMLEPQTRYGITVDGGVFCRGKDDPADAPSRWQIRLPFLKTPRLAAAGRSSTNPLTSHDVEQDLQTKVASMFLATDLLLVTDLRGGTLYALDKADGRLRWRYSDWFPITNPVPLADRIWVANATGALTALSPVDGKVLETRDPLPEKLARLADFTTFQGLFFNPVKKCFYINPSYSLIDAWRFQGKEPQPGYAFATMGERELPLERPAKPTGMEKTAQATPRPARAARPQPSPEEAQKKMDEILTRLRTPHFVRGDKWARLSSKSIVLNDLIYRDIPGAEKAIPDLIHVVNTPEFSSDDERVDALRVLLKLCGRPALAYLPPLIRTDSLEIRKEVMPILVEYHERRYAADLAAMLVEPVVEHELAKRSPEQQRYARAHKPPWFLDLQMDEISFKMRALHTLISLEGRDAVRLVRPLLSAMPPRVQKEAVMWLVLLGDTGLQPQLREKSAIPDYENVSGEDETRNADYLLIALAKSGDTAAQELLQKHLLNYRYRKDLATVLATCWQDKNLVPVLAPLLQPDATGKRAFDDQESLPMIASALAKTGSRDAIPLLVGCMKSTINTSYEWREHGFWTYPVDQALESLSGQSFGANRARWEQWMAGDGGFAAKERAGTPAPSGPATKSGR